jgi:flagellar M-ring protein FliF
MKGFASRFIKRLQEIWNRLDTRQRIILSSLVIITVLLFAWLIQWSTRVEYGLLFGNMEPEEVKKAVDQLKDQKIKYQLGEGGTSILVPTDQVDQARIELSASGIASKTGTGFEIFDRTRLGKTEFDQKIDFQRALEGELQRTIQSIPIVEYVRVHLVIPEEKLFKEDQHAPTASVYLKTKQKLTERQVQGIANLISSAVEGLDIAKVSITDQDGNELTETYDDDTAIGASNFQIKVQSKYEDFLRNKVQSMLDQMLEPNTSIVRVSALLNFDKIESTMENFDPESKVTRSEELESSSSTQKTDDISSQTEHSITNYEISKTVRHIQNQVGDVKRLTVSVSVDHRLQVTESGKAGLLSKAKINEEYLPRTPEEMQQIADLVRNAVGFSDDRGDQITVTNVRFDDAREKEEERIINEEQSRADLIKTAERGAVLLILFLLVLILFGQFRKVFTRTEDELVDEPVRPALATGEIEHEGFYPEGEEGMPMGEGKITYAFKPMKDIEIAQTDTHLMQESVKQFIIEHPDTAVRLIKSWLLEKPGGAK